MMLGATPVHSTSSLLGIHAMADASWGERNIYGILIMMNNGVIVAETKKMGPVDSSAEAEGIATSKCAEILENVREIARPRTPF